MLEISAARGFASDNSAGIHPRVLAAIAAVNAGHQLAYGQDAATERLQAVMQAQFGEHAVAFPVFNGTGANVLALQAMLPRWGAVVATEGAHIHRSEAGAAEKVGGIKLLTVPAGDGKLTPELVDREAWGWGDEHRAQPLAVSIAQSTELGTLYTPAELRALADHAHERGMLLHMDGARLPNAAAALGLPLRALTTDAGVDVLSLGGTKHGALAAEAVVALTPAVAGSLRWLRKIDLQLASKMRFLSAQLLALYEGELWRETAGHANAMAARLRDGLEPLPGVGFSQPTQANAVFAQLPEGVVARLAESFLLNARSASAGHLRLMCAWDTSADDVDALVTAAREAIDSLGADRLAPA